MGAEGESTTKRNIDVAELDVKRGAIARSTERIGYHRRRMEERPALRELYRYWMHYHITRRADRLTDLWLEELRDVLKPEVRTGVTPERASAIRDYLSYVEDQRKTLVGELVETRRLAVERMWHIAWPKEYDTMEVWISACYGRMAGITFWIREIQREIPPPVPKPLVGVIDSTTGYKIMLLDAELTVEREGKMLKGWVWLYDEVEKEYVEPAENVRVEFTASVETEGNEDLGAEITGWTIVYGIELDGKHAIKDKVDQLIKKIIDWFYKKFAPPPEGEAWFGGPVPKESMVPDFTIQEREKTAKFEGTIQQWAMTLEGWVEQPRVIKAGIGFYSTDETDPHFPITRVYAEYAHEEEPIGTDKLPEELIDP